MRILVLLPCQPFPAYNGQTHRLALVARSLAQNHDVALACLIGPEQVAELSEVDRALFTEVRLVEITGRAVSVGETLLRRFSSNPGDVYLFRSERMASHVADLVRRYDPEVILVGDPALTPYVEGLRGRMLAIDYVCEATLQFDRMAALASPLERPLWRLRRAKYARFLKRIEPLYDVAFLNSVEDVDALAQIWPRSKLMHVANGLDLSGYPLGLAQPTQDRLIYPGAVTYPPNRDAVAWFADEILPLIWSERPGVELWVTGAKPASGAPEGPGIVYTGRVPDIRAEIAGAWATVVPLRLGAGGARFKVIESMALGAPLVGTAIGVEGLELTDGIDYLHAESPSDFAAACLNLLSDPGLRDRVGAAARHTMETRYDWRTLYRRLESRLMDGARTPRAMAS